VLGPVTSDHTLTLYEATEAREMVLLSSTAATSTLSEKDDHFFRTFVSTNDLATRLAEYVYNERKITEMAVVYDTDNLSYTETICDAFSARFNSLGGKIMVSQKFSSSATPDFGSTIKEIKFFEPQGILMITAPADAALIAQAIHLENWKPALFGAPWTQGPALIEMGGVTVEGMEAITPFDINEDSEDLQKFIQDYQSIYGEQPLFAAVSGYETMMYLEQALHETRGRSAGLPEALLAVKDFSGLSSPIQLDAFGDAKRPLIIQKVNEGQFITITHLEPGS
jgi:branched-chain amino acid transport system substrate-binding protein